MAAHLLCMLQVLRYICMDCRASPAGPTIIVNVVECSRVRTHSSTLAILLVQRHGQRFHEDGVHSYIDGDVHGHRVSISLTKNLAKSGFQGRMTGPAGAAVAWTGGLLRGETDIITRSSSGNCRGYERRVEEIFAFC